MYPCPVTAAISMIGGKWKPIILWLLYGGAKRFGELDRMIPAVTQKMLIQQLRELETDGLVHREVHHVVPPKVEYSLTQSGRDLEPVLLALERFGGTLLAQRAQSVA